jgi:hypothetical protein
MLLPNPRIRSLAAPIRPKIANPEETPNIPAWVTWNVNDPRVDRQDWQTFHAQQRSLPEGVLQLVLREEVDGRKSAWQAEIQTAQGQSP